jgi:hypothetical protein
VRVDQDGRELARHLAELKPGSVVRGDGLLLGEPSLLVVPGASGALRGGRAFKLRLEAENIVAMNRPEVGDVSDVFDDFAGVRLDVDGAVHPGRPFVAPVLLEDRDVVFRGPARWVMPHHHHAVALERRPRPHFGFGGDLLGVRHIAAFAGAIEAPSVKRTANRIPFDFPAVPEMSPEVGAEGVEYARLARGRPPNHEISPKVAGRLRAFHLELFTEADDEPASRVLGGDGRVSTHPRRILPPLVDARECQPRGP